MSQAAAVAPRGAQALAPAPSGGQLSTDTMGGQRKRTPLSVVPARPARRRVPFAVFVVAALAAALAAVLMLNISVTSTQYDLVQLRNQQIGLSQENEALVLEIEGREAPQNLAAAATELDMVSSPTFGTLELGSDRVTGSPEPAKEGPEPEVLIAAPNLVTEQPAPVAVAPAPVALEAAPAESPENAQAGAPVDTEGTAGTPAEVDVAEASGAEIGTIPGPVQTGIGR